jgi:hypothetical protein
MPILKLVSVMGSFRDVEIDKFRFIKDIESFKIAMSVLGRELALSEHDLLIAWSNDNIPDQFSNGRYKFQDTADYSVLIGYLSTIINKNNKKVLAHLVVSNEMWNGVKNSKGDRFKAISSLMVDGTDVTLDECVTRGILRIRRVSGREEDYILRTDLLKDHIVPHADLVIAVGGGKATGAAMQLARSENKLLPLGFWGGSSRQTLLDIFSSSTSQPLAERIRYITHGLSLEFEQYKEDDVLKAIMQISKDLDRFIRYDRRVFIAMPFKNSVDLDPKYDHEEVFDAARRTIARLKEKWPGLELIRIDRTSPKASDIPSEIRETIRQCGIFIADLTELDREGSSGITSANPNVWWELGFADGLGKERVILLARKGTQLPFNNSVRRVTMWDDSADIESAVRRGVEDFLKSQ